MRFPNVFDASFLKLRFVSSLRGRILVDELSKGVVLTRALIKKGLKLCVSTIRKCLSTKTAG